MVGTMGSRGNLAKEHWKAHMHFQQEIHLHLLLEVLHHLGVDLHLGVHLHLKVHHLLPKVYFPFLVVLHPHEENYHCLS